ncbi:MAG: hypothetical protein NTY77_17195 [Elusimicrobia bacterium]|nr:hypothetical protein [Elusimicrobiota bacterium]
MTTLILAAALAAGAAAAPQPGPDAGGLLNLSCIEALAAVRQPNLAGVFSFISEKDSPAAFADLVAHDGKALKRYVEKVGRDFEAAGGVTTWDHEALLFALALYSGPLAATFEKPSAKLMARISELSLSPTLSLEQVTARRKK